MKPTPPNVKKKPGRPKTSEPSVVKATILQTASALFMQYGYDSVSMEQISADSGVTKASVYYYFPNKAELFTAAVIRMMKNIAGITQSILAAPGSMRERLTAVAEAHMRTPHVDFESLMREAASSLTAAQTAAIREAEHSVHVVLAEAFRLEIEAGAIRSGDPLLYAYAFSAIMMLGGRSAGDASSAPLFSPVAPSDVVDLFWCGVGRMV
ncbi:TetR/AcrR family transcriptional regulator [Paenibacillus mesophilus]|uniref:TetR/AcrR family transcriptional regulator n=1 Tax=Paenibacillus mesophilus TaxID=2582849 RepID=UPI00130516C0|nr:TetR/AcrR family transcriptional regulator [Paenibacillus mesophilus]